MAKDILHEVVRQVLELDGWKITHDPLELREYDPEWAVDFGAEKIIAAERGLEKIAVEVKSFRETSFAHEFHGILGQYLNYRSGLKRVAPDRALFLAVPIEIFESEFSRKGIANSVSDYQMNLIIYDPNSKAIEQWKR